jgi:hypothetical protein
VLDLRPKLDARRGLLAIRIVDEPRELSARRLAASLKPDLRVVKARKPSP